MLRHQPLELAPGLLYHGAMKKQVRKLGLKAETIRALSDMRQVVGGLYSGLSCSNCSLSTNALTLNGCEAITCSCNAQCAKL